MLERITPACAGKSVDYMCVVRFQRDHPRMCGEKCMFPVLLAQFEGSPPHVRGKVDEVLPGDTFSGITPACAGKRIRIRTFDCCVRDHPRMCGEKRDQTEEQLKELGSPPHVRGKDNGSDQDVIRFRITPACAGKRLKRSRSTVLHAAIVPLFPSVCNKPAGSDGSPAGHDAPPFLPIENAAPASPAYNLRSL